MRYTCLFSLCFSIYFLISGCCACDCYGDSRIDIEFFNKATGEEIRITETCDTTDLIADIEIFNAPQETYNFHFCGNEISMDLNLKNSNLCADNTLQFHVLFQDEIIETVTARFENRNNSCCDCFEACMELTELRRDSMFAVNTGTNNIRIEI